MAQAKAYIVGTLDTKGEELLYIRDLLAADGVEACVVDVGTGSADRPPGVDVSNVEVAAHHPDGADAVLTLEDRGQAVAAMGEALARFLPTRDDIGGVIGAGGSGNTALVAQGMRSLPIGVPRVLVSTVASGDVAPYVGPNDITMMYSVVDVAGLNRISRVVLANAAHALAGMMQGATPAGEDKPAIGLTMFGVTTSCVDQVRAELEARYDCLVFHATGTGGRSMEKLVDSGMVLGCIDSTTTEVCDHLMGGVFSAGEDRLGAFARTGLPYVGSCGALDMVNFGARETVPAQFQDRTFHVHNPNVSLMRTTPEENAAMGEWIGAKLNACQGPVRFLIPEKGVSLIDAPGMPFHDPDADAALFEALDRTVEQTPARRLIRLPLHINDADFARALVESWNEIAA